MWCVCVCVCCLCVKATKVSADGEQVEDDADRIHKRAEDLEQFINSTLLRAKGSRKKHYLTSMTTPMTCQPM